MTKLQWFLLILGLQTVFIYFAVTSDKSVEASILDNSPVLMSLSTDNGVSRFENLDAVPKAIVLRYHISNISNTSLDADKYFYRIILGRDLGSPGFILEELSHSVPVNASIDGDLVWDLSKFGIPPEGGPINIFLNLYEDVPNEEPVLLGSARRSLIFPRITSVNTD